MPKVKLSKIEMNYEATGEGTPVVLIPGLYSNTITSSLNVLRTYFQRSRRPYRIIIADSRGCGLSSMVDSDFTTEDMAEDWNELLSILGVENAHIIGSSMGSMIAQYMAINHPEKVKTLVLLDSTPRATTYLRKLLDFWCLILERFDYADFSKLVNLMCAPWTFYEKHYDQIEQLEKQTREILLKLPPFDHVAFKRQCHAVATHDCTEEINRITVPTLVISGEKDIICPAQLAKSMSRRIPRAKFVVMKDSGHAVVAQRPAQCADIILRFLEKA